MTDSSSQFSRPSDIDISKRSNPKDAKKQFFELVNKASVDKDFQIINNENLCILKNSDFENKQNYERENTPLIKQQVLLQNYEQVQQIKNLSEIKEENSSLEKSLYSQMNEKRVSEKIKNVFKKQNKTPEIDIQDQDNKSYNSVLIKNLATLKSNIKKLNTENSIKNKQEETPIDEQKETITDLSQDIKRVDVYLDTEEDQKRQSTNSTYQKNITFKGLRDIAKIKHYQSNVNKQKLRKKNQSAKIKNKKQSFKYPIYSSQRSAGSFNKTFKAQSKQSFDFKRKLKQKNILNKFEYKKNDTIPIKNILQEQNQITDDAQRIENYLTKEIKIQQNKINQNTKRDKISKPSFSSLKKQFSSDLSYSNPVLNRTSFIKKVKVNKNITSIQRYKSKQKKTTNNYKNQYFNKRSGSANFTNKIQRN